MKKFIIASIIFLCLILVILFAVSSGGDDENNIEETKEEVVRTSFNLPIQTRNYKIGLAGYTPINFPSPETSDALDFWDDVEEYSEVYGVHTNWTDTLSLDVAAKSQNNDIELVLGFQEPGEWMDKKGEYIAKAKDVLKKYPQIKYLAVGNEVNIEFEEHPNEFENFINSYKEIYDSIKQEFPAVKVYTVFQYDFLKGDGYLSGKKDSRNPQWDILTRLEDKLDLIGLTAYAYFDYKTPAEIPDTYFSDIRAYSQKPLAITETGWMSRTAFGGKNAPISNQGFAGSEIEQSDYLKKLVTLLNNENVEYVNWFPLNDISDWVDSDEGMEGFELFDSIGLRNNDGVSKHVFNLWLELKTI